MTEKQLKIRVINDLETIPGIWFFKTQEVGRRGIPDILICSYGKFLALELKTDQGRIDALQKLTLERIASSGGFSFVVRPSTWEQQLNLMKENGWL